MQPTIGFLGGASQIHRKQNAKEGTILNAQADPTEFKPRKTVGDRGGQYKRNKLLAGKTPKDLGIRKTFKKRIYFYATCDHKDKRGRLNCKKKFGGWTLRLIMGNKAAHENAHEEQDRRIAEMAGVS